MSISVLYVGNKLSHLGLTPGIIESLGMQLEQSGLTVNYAGTKRNPILRLSEMLLKVFKLRKKTDYVLIDTYSTSAFWFAFLVGITCKFFSIKYIPVLHGGNLPSRLKSTPVVARILFNKSYTNVAVSGYLKHEFESAGYKTILIPNNINISNYPFRERTDPKPRILWVRSFSSHYNPEMAADVLSELLKHYPEAVLCMVGPGVDNSLSEFRKYIDAKGIADKIKITGKLSKEEWIKLSAGYDFFINTTNVDNTPVSVIEALALGLLVVSTNPGGIPYLLTDAENACLVECGDSKKMADVITRMLNDNLKFKYIVDNGRILAESFDWNRIKPLWLSVLK